MDEALGLVVERGGGFVEEQNARIVDDGSRDGDALFLTAGDATAADTDVRLVPFRHHGDEFVRVGRFRGGDDLLARGDASGHAGGDVVVNASGEERRFLFDDAHVSAEPHEIQLSEVDTIDVHLTRASCALNRDLERLAVVARCDLFTHANYFVKALQELNRRRFPATRLSDQRHSLSRVHFETQTTENGGVPRRVREKDILELNLPRQSVDDFTVLFLVGVSRRFRNLSRGLFDLRNLDERLRVNTRRSIDEFKDAPGGRGAIAIISSERRRLSHAGGAKAERPERLHEIHEIQLTFLDQLTSPPEGKSIEPHRQRLGETERTARSERLATFLSRRRRNRRIVVGRHLLLETERLHVLDHGHRFGDSRRSLGDGFVQRRRVLEVFHVEHLTDAQHGDAREKHQAVFPTRRERDGESKRERRRRLNHAPETLSSHRSNLCGIRLKQRGQRADRVFLFVEERDVLTHD